MSQPEIGNYHVNYQNYQNYPPWILNEHLCIYSCLQIPPRKNWFQYLRRVYAIAINFPLNPWAGYCKKSDRAIKIKTDPAQDMVGPVLAALY